jgi:hypothetical protein
MNETGQEQGPELGGAGGGLEVPAIEPGEAGPAGLASLLEAAAGVGDAFGLAGSAVPLISEAASDAVQAFEGGETLGAGLGGAPLEAGEAGPAGSALEALRDIGQAARHAEETVSGDVGEAIGAVGAAGGAVADRVAGGVSEAAELAGAAGKAVFEKAGEMVEPRPAGAGGETPPDQQADLRVEAPRFPEQAPRDR